MRGAHSQCRHWHYDQKSFQLSMVKGPSLHRGFNGTHFHIKVMLLPNRGKLNECEMLHSQEDCFSGVPCLLLLVALSIFSCEDQSVHWG